MSNLKVIKWNIYIAEVPFTDDLTQFKRRPVIVIGIVGDNLIILPTTTQILKKQQQDFEIQLDRPSIIQVGNIQSINKKRIVKRYYSKSNPKIVIDEQMKKAILFSLIKVCS